MCDFCRRDGAPASGPARPSVCGKFIVRGTEKFYVRGVTYGTFRPDGNGSDFPHPSTAERDFGRMAANGINAVRTYTVPPAWVLDAAGRNDLLVMVGIPWEHHVAFLDDRERARSIESRVRAGVRACAEHPAVLCYSIANEIPAPIVRWHGPGRVERFLERLYDTAKDEDPDGLVTYVSYPSTEYLRLPFIDLVCFNVFLERREQLDSYLPRLHNLAGERPLVLTELGLDSRRNGEEAQATALEWQIRTAFENGCAGAVVFAWTDEWHRGGYEVDDWDFGVTDRARRPKPALAAVREAFSHVPFGGTREWPRVSVVVCTHNGAETLGECLRGIARLEYPDFETIVVDDGSTDATAAVAEGFGVRLVRTDNRGLSAARNTGLHAAEGDIVAYLDDDAWPDPHWLAYLAHALTTSEHVAVGGPNIAPPGDGRVADAVAHAPGGPVHVLLSDREAEHIPGCNMAFRRDRLLDVGGFDPQFRVAGDDVDVCWRLRDRGWTLGFSPAAVVWHHRRASIRAYLRQQRQYGKAEALLERKWPERYNRGGHLAWTGRVYGDALAETLRGRWRVYYGTWGSGLFQSLYQRPAGLFASLPLVPEWYLVLAALAAVSAVGLLWPPLLVGWALFTLALGALVVPAVRAATRARFPSASRLRAARISLRALTGFLFLVQPLARLSGRLRYGLTPWRRRGKGLPAVPWWRTTTTWSEDWQSPDDRVRTLEATLAATSGAVSRGGEYDRWDLQVRGGLFGAVRLRMAVEEHGAGRQLARVRSWPRLSRGALALAVVMAALAVAAGLDGAWPAALALASGAGALVVTAVRDCAVATAAVLRAIAPPPDDLVSALEERVRTGRAAVVAIADRSEGRRG